jgi:hypothetical protein
MLAVRFPINREPNSPQKNRRLRVEPPFLTLRRFRAKNRKEPMKTIVHINLGSPSSSLARSQSRWPTPPRATASVARLKQFNRSCAATRSLQKATLVAPLSSGERAGVRGISDAYATGDQKHRKTPRHFNISTREPAKPAAISIISIRTPKTFGHFNFSRSEI